MASELAITHDKNRVCNVNEAVNKVCAENDDK